VVQPGVQWDPRFSIGDAQFSSLGLPEEAVQDSRQGFSHALPGGVGRDRSQKSRPPTPIM
jgi:hypothetical protein